MRMSAGASALRQVSDDVAAGQFLAPRSRHCASPAPTFPAESCNRCPRARPPRSGRSYAARGGTPAAAQITRIGRRRLTRSGLTLAQTTKGLGRARRGPGQGGNRDSAGGNSAGVGTSGPARPRQPAELGGTARRACDANPLAGFGSEASKDQHHVLDASHTTKGMTAQ